MSSSRNWVINYLYYIQAIQDSHWYKTWTTKLWKEVDETLLHYWREGSQLDMLDGATNTFLEKSPMENQRICNCQVLTKEGRWEGNVQMSFRTTKLFLMTINKFKSVECTKRILFLFLFFLPSLAMVAGAHTDVSLFHLVWKPASFSLLFLYNRCGYKWEILP